MVKRKSTCRFPPARIKKIMQIDDEVGKISNVTPVIISRALELFAEELLEKSCAEVTSRGMKTLTPSHIKACIEKVPHFDFLKTLVENVADCGEESDSPKAKRPRKPKAEKDGDAAPKPRKPKAKPAAAAGAAAPAAAAAKPVPASAAAVASDTPVVSGEVGAAALAALRKPEPTAEEDEYD